MITTEIATSGTHYNTRNSLIALLLQRDSFISTWNSPRAHDLFLVARKEFVNHCVDRFVQVPLARNSAKKKTIFRQWTCNFLCSYLKAHFDPPEENFAKISFIFADTHSLSLSSFLLIFLLVRLTPLLIHVSSIYHSSRPLLKRA